MQQKNGNKSMIKISEIKMPVGYTEEMVTASILKKLHLKNDTALTWNYFKKSIDARKKQQIQYQISVLVSHPNEQKLLQQASARKEKTSHLISLMFIRFRLFLKDRKIVRWLLDLAQLVCLPLLF